MSLCCLIWWRLRLWVVTIFQYASVSCTPMERGIGGLGDQHYACSCGRSFSAPGALNFHRRTCQSSKCCLHGALAKAKELWEKRKKPRLDSPVLEEPVLPGDLARESDDSAGVQEVGPHFDTAAGIQVDSLGGGQLNHPSSSAVAAKNDDYDHLSLAERRPRRLDRRLPKRFRDELPQPPPSLPPANSNKSSAQFSIAESESALRQAPVPPSILRDATAAQAGTAVSSRSPRILGLFRTPRNIFGLWRRYFAERLPSHDPEELVTLTDLCSDPAVDSTLRCQHNSRSQSAEPHDLTSFYPYPNEASFCLGNWYWNSGVQKSQESFRELIDIVGNPGFDPSDVRPTKWDKINTILASNDSQDEEEWMDVDAGWKKKQIRISVPFNERTENPGTRNYLGGDLYYRSLVDMIREKLANPHDAKRFHYEPYEYIWEPSNQHKEIKVHGELYTSQAFLETHSELQKSPGEPNCDLPRVVVALMFWSDETHLTSFGNTKLWPCYLNFGNKSKYRRCKPSNHLCSHIAYFQKVSSS
jgi:hypothetical protein